MSKFFQGVVLALILTGLYACTNAETIVSPSVTSTPIVNLATSVVLIPTGVTQPTNVSTIGALTPIVIEQPTLQTTATIGPTVTGYKYPPAALQIERPGASSKLISPFLVSAIVFPGEGGMVNVQLFGEDGRLMADQLIQLSKSETGPQSLATEIKFEPISAGESALVVISTRDYYGRRMAQIGVPVTLLQIGKSEIENAQFNKEAVLLKSPVAGGFYKNGNLHIEGLIHLFNGNPIIVELFTQTGGIAANKAVYVKGSEGVDFVPFSLDLPYSVSKRTPVRVTIRQAGETSSSVDISLFSQLIFLDP